MRDEAVRRVLIVDDHPIIQEGFSQLLGRQKDLEVCGVAAEATEALRLVEAQSPHLVLIDLALGNSNGLDLVRTVKSRHRSLKVLVVSMYDDKIYAERALNAGALGYVNKKEATRKLVEAVQFVLRGKIYVSDRIKESILQRVRGSEDVTGSSPIERLSDRELQVFQLIGTGLTTAEIADHLRRSIHTIDTHRQRIKAKLNLKNSAELAQAAARWVLEAGAES